MSPDKITGIFAATTTPFCSDGSFNRQVVQTQIDMLIDAGMTGIVPAGGTGEASALSFAERIEVVSATVEAVGGRVPVIAGVTSPGLADALALGRACLDAGASSLMVITPYGTGASQAGIRDYYKAVADELGQPVMLYDIPYLTGVTTQPETVREIASDGSIFAMKASNRDQAVFVKLMRMVGADIAVMAGDEDLFAVEVALGAVGGVLASCNVLPRTWVEIFESARSGDLSSAQQQLARLQSFLANVYSEPHPAPLKVAQALAGFDAGPVRIPNKQPSAALVAALGGDLPELLEYERRLAE